MYIVGSINIIHFLFSEIWHYNLFHHLRDLYSDVLSWVNTMTRKFQTTYIDWLDLNLSRLAHVKLTSTLKRSGTGRLSSSFTTQALIPSMNWKNILHTSVRFAIFLSRKCSSCRPEYSSTTCGIHTRGPLDTKHTHINPCAHTVYHSVYWFCFQLCI